MGLKKVQKQGREENTRRLSCYRKVMVKERLENYSTSAARPHPLLIGTLQLYDEQGNHRTGRN